MSAPVLSSHLVGRMMACKFAAELFLLSCAKSLLSEQMLGAAMETAGVQYICECERFSLSPSKTLDVQLPAVACKLSSSGASAEKVIAEEKRLLA